MRKLIIGSLFTVLASAAFYALFWSHVQEHDELVIALSDNSFLPIRPPSKLHTVGGIYYIDPGLSRITRLCSPHNELSETAIQKSPGPVITGVLTLQGAHAAKLKANSGQPIGGTGSVDDQRKLTLNFKLTNVRIYEIDVDLGKGLLDKLMNRKDCIDTVVEYWRLNGYICQDTQLLVATADFDRKFESDTAASIDWDAQKMLSELEAATNVRLTGAEGRSTTGEGLQWGMQIPPLCISPPWARFPRTFPRSNFDKVLNFIKFNIVEPMLPSPPAD